MASGSSLLHWTRGMLAVRAEHEVFGMGDYVPCEADNDTVLAFARIMPEDAEEDPHEGSPAVLCVNNLSSRPQSATVTLPASLAGAEVHDLFGGQGFVGVSPDGTITLTLGSRGFYWLGLTPATEES